MAIIFDVVSLLVCVLLGAHRSRMVVAAAFVYGIISIVQIPVVYFIAVVVRPLIDTPNLYETAAQFPQLYYSGLFFNNIIVAICCFLAARWLGETQIKPPLKYNVFFSVLFVMFALIVLLWWNDILKIMSISLLPSALLGTLLLGILILLFYLYTRLIVKKEIPAMDYVQYLQQLSKRELELVEALIAGNDSYKKLAMALNISINTVKTHLKHIYQTTGISNLTALSTLFRGYSSVTLKSP